MPELLCRACGFTVFSHVLNEWQVAGTQKAAALLDRGERIVHELVKDRRQFLGQQESLSQRQN